MRRIALLLILVGITGGSLRAQDIKETRRIGPTEKMSLRLNTRDRIMMYRGHSRQMMVQRRLQTKTIQQRSMMHQRRMMTNQQQHNRQQQMQRQMYRRARERQLMQQRQMQQQQHRRRPGAGR